MSEIKLLNGDCIDEMKDFNTDSIDAIICDPPYELGFMGKKWDSSGIAYNIEVWKQALRILKPGGHLLAFGGTRTYHRMACAIEDSGFEIRDCIQWIYGSGFPKSMDISKAIDKKFSEGKLPKDLAKYWDGWGTCLKPANEPIVLARKPISEKTIIDNVLKYSTGGINVDACRIPTDELKISKGRGTQGQDGIYGEYGLGGIYTPNKNGRFPSNVILDEVSADMLDRQTGISKSTDNLRNSSHTKVNCYGKCGPHISNGYSDVGGASRFFYCAKASRKERDCGLGKFNNKHPTVKPIKLMEYLVKLITPKNGIVLDPFMGSGTTGIACKNTNRNFIGIELDETYYNIAKERIENAICEKELF